MMTSKKHNKRRNVGLLWEFLVRDVTRSLVEGDSKRSNAAIRILKRYFRPGTETFKEFMLFKALSRTTLSEPPAVASLLSEAKRAAQHHNLVTLEREKTNMIHEINRTLDRPDFWEQSIPDYTLLATVQTMINDWRSGDSIVLERMAKFEEQVGKWLMTEKREVELESGPTPDSVEQLAVNIMVKRLNEKWSGLLTDDQKRVLRLHIFSDGRSQEMVEFLRQVGQETATLVERYLATAKVTDAYNVGPLQEALEIIKAESVSSLDDETVSRFLTIIKLRDELRAGGEQ
jgi:hypothetical protein